MTRYSSLGLWFLARSHRTDLVQGFCIHRVKNKTKKIQLSSALTDAYHRLLPRKRKLTLFWEDSIVIQQENCTAEKSHSKWSQTTSTTAPPHRLLQLNPFESLEVMRRMFPGDLCTVCFQRVLWAIVPFDRQDPLITYCLRYWVDS